MTKTELKDIVRECMIESGIINENTTISSVKKSNGRYKFYLNKKFKGVQIVLGSGFSDQSESDKESNEKKLDTFDEDFKALNSSWNSIEKQVMKYIKEYCENWEQDPADINKYAKIDYVSYTKYYSNISKSYNIHFDIYYNSENTANKNKFLGGHCIVVVVNIVNGKAILDEYSPTIEG